MRIPSSLLVAVAVVAVSGCSGGGMSSPSVPAGAHSGGIAQSQSRAPLAHKKASAGSYALFGDAVLVHPGHNSPTAVQASTDGSSTYGGIDFGAPVTTLQNLNNLSSDVQLVSGTNGTCAFGSPRFDIGLTNGTTSGDLFVNMPCTPSGWSNTGNVICDTCIVFPSNQICSGASCISGETYAQAKIDFSSYTVNDIAIVVDASNGAEVVQFDNTGINNQVFTYESAGSCKDGGWQQFTSSPGPFKNQGDCVSYFNNGK